MKETSLLYLPTTVFVFLQMWVEPQTPDHLCSAKHCFVQYNQVFVSSEWKKNSFSILLHLNVRTNINIYKMLYTDMYFDYLATRLGCFSLSGDITV